MTQRSVPSVRLVAVAGDTQHKFAIERFPCTVGRSSRCDVVIADRSMSGRHFMLTLEDDGGVMVCDLGSTNGMYHAGKRIERLALTTQLQLRMGNVQVELQLQQSAPAATAATAGVTARSGAADSILASAIVPKKGDCYYRREGREQGPFSWDEMVGMAHAGALRRSDAVWKEGNQGWMKADCILGLFGKAAAEPAPPAPVDQPSPTQGSAALPPPPSPALLREQISSARKYAARGSKGSIVCPHCWHAFEVEDFLYVARHQDLVGDPVLGPDAPQRFLPSKFTAEGNAIDSMGMSCPDVACPYCHLRIPQTAGEMAPLFLSIVGATASGKSYLLTGMVWELRNILAKLFAISFTDTDAVNNQILNEFEETIFLSSDAEELVALRKTELQGELYNQVMLNGMVINLPKPFMFTVAPSEHHPAYAQAAAAMSRTLVLYDNAGEHFEPGMDSVDNPTTRHLLHSDTIFFLYDPTKDVRFRKLCSGEDPQLDKHARVQRQEILLTEMVNRIKKYSGMRAGTKSDKTLMVIVPKADLWLHLLDHDFAGEPWVWDGKQNMHTLNIDEIKNVSFAMRHLLERLCPELVVTAESFASEVLYVPTSALGRSPELHAETGILGIRPKDLKPFWVAVPMLYFFHKHGMIGATPRQLLPERQTLKVEAKIAGDVAFVNLPQVSAEAVRVPLFYEGARLHLPDTELWLELPARRRQRRTPPPRRRPNNSDPTGS